MICCTLSAPIQSVCSSALVNISISGTKAAHSFKPIGAFERARAFALVRACAVHANEAYWYCKSANACGCYDTRVIRITIISRISLCACPCSACAKFLDFTFPSCTLFQIFLIYALPGCLIPSVIKARGRAREQTTQRRSVWRQYRASSSFNVRFRNT